MSVIRAFIATEISHPVQQKLDEILKQLQQKTSGLPMRWVPVHNIHLTLFFLGDVSTTNVQTVSDELHAEAAKHSTFEFAVAKLGAFPNPNRPRVVWIGVEAPPVLAELQRGIAMRMSHLGYTNEEREYTPHLTLGRVARTASPEDVRRIGEYVQQVKVGQLGMVKVLSVNLFRSDLQPGGPVYERIAESPLGIVTPGG